MMKRPLIHPALNAHGRRRVGFTLIEILVVVAIIALLISILLPSLARAREQTRRTLCAHQLEQFGKATLMYTMDSKESLPGPVHAAVELETAELSGNFEYFGWHLPAFIRKYFAERGKGNGKMTEAVSSCPTSVGLSGQKLDNSSNKGSIYRTFTYAINNSNKNYSASMLFGTDPAWYFGYPDEYWNNAPAPFTPRTATAWTKDAVPKKINRVNQPSREWAIADAFTYYKGVYPGSTVNPLPLNGRRDGQWRYGTYWLYTWASRPEVNLPNKPMHSDGINQLCFDGHVEWQRPWRGTINQK